jgi:hypothetical protein
MRQSVGLTAWRIIDQDPADKRITTVTIPLSMQLRLCLSCTPSIIKYGLAREAIFQDRLREEIGSGV